MSRGPASVIVDEAGNLVGVDYDGTTYRLQVEAVVANTDGESADIESDGLRSSQAISYPELLSVAVAILDRLDLLLAHIATMTDEEDPL